MTTMLAADNGISTSYFQLYEAGSGNVAGDLEQLLQGADYGCRTIEDDILSCVHFLMVDVMSARGLLGSLAA